MTWGQDQFKTLKTYAHIQIYSGIVCWCLAVFALLLVFLYVASRSAEWSGIGYGVIWILGLFFIGLQLGALGQSCLVVMQIEANTRWIAQNAERKNHNAVGTR